MARGINKVILIGNLGNEPEVRYAPSNTAVTTVSIATGDSWKDKQTGEMQDRTEWHRVVFFGRLAEVAGEWLHKGSKVYIEGSLRTRKWQDKNGQERYTTEVVASDMQMLDSKGTAAAAELSENYGGTGAARGTSSSGSSVSGGSHAAGSATQAAGGSGAAMPDTAALDDGFDDDIPF